jgi:small conductance mechanosensitive channel
VSTQGDGGLVAAVAEWLRVPGWTDAIVTLGRIGLIVLLATVVQVLLSRLIRGIRIRIAARLASPEQVRRAETLGRALRYATAVMVTVVAAALVLSELGVSIAPILGAAGVVGVAVGFGAQSLVKDYFAGAFLLLENQLARGDVVRVADHAGVVEDLTLRYVQLRDYDGNVHFVPNGLITTVTNMSREFAYAVVDVGVAYGEDLGRVFEVMRRTAAAMRMDPAFGECILDAFDLAGVERWEESAIVVRGRFRVRALQQWNVRREYLRRLREAFREERIEIPFPQLTIHQAAPGT